MEAWEGEGLSARERTLAFLAWMKAEIPGCELRFKDDSPWTMPWRDRVLHALGRLVTPGYDRRYTTVLHPRIYLPVGAREVFARSPERYYATLRHEYVHLKDFQRYPVWMPLSYAALLPVCWTMRSFWELRGYTQTMLCEYEATGRVSDETVARLSEVFAGRGYVYMMWPRRRAQRALMSLRERIERGELRGPYPY